MPCSCALPLKDPNRLVIAISDLRNRNVHDFPFSNANFIDLRDGTKSAFQDFAGTYHGLSRIFFSVHED